MDLYKFFGLMFIISLIMLIGLLMDSVVGIMITLFLSFFVMAAIVYFTNKL